MLDIVGGDPRGVRRGLPDLLPHLGRRGRRGRLRRRGDHAGRSLAAGRRRRLHQRLGRQLVRAAPDDPADVGRARRPGAVGVRDPQGRLTIPVIAAGRLRRRRARRDASCAEGARRPDRHRPRADRRRRLAAARSQEGAARRDPAVHRLQRVRRPRRPRARRRAAPSTPRSAATAPGLIEPADTPRRVMVVGSGPSGMEAARIARLRGHEVSIWERDPVLGRQARRRLARAEQDHGADLRRLPGAHARRARRRRSTPTSKSRRTTVAARGARRGDRRHRRGPARAADPGARRPGRCVDAQEHPARAPEPIEPGERVVVIGGSATGCETAEFLMGTAGDDHDRRDAPDIVGRGIELITRQRLVKDLQARRRAASSRLARRPRVEPGAVYYESTADGEAHVLEVDRVALAIGWRRAATCSAHGAQRPRGARHRRRRSRRPTSWPRSTSARTRGWRSARAGAPGGWARCRRLGGAGAPLNRRRLRRDASHRATTWPSPPPPARAQEGRKSWRVSGGGLKRSAQQHLASSQPAWPSRGSCGGGR